MLRRPVVAAAAMVVVPLAAILPANAANAAGTECADGVAVSQFAFNPPSISPTSSSVLTLVLQNCTSQTIQGSTIWWGQYIGPSGQHCVTLDPPAPFPYAIAPGGTYTRSATYQDIDSACSASLNATANVNGVTGTATSVTATLQFTTTCTSGVTVKQFSFSPAAVAVGQDSTLTLVLQNCTSQTVQGSSIWYPEFTWEGTDVPPGCPGMDPVGLSYSMAPGGTSTTTLGFSDPVATCRATGLLVTANVSENGVTGTVATAAANLVINQPVSGGCHVTYTPNNWPGGFTADVTITNNGSDAINGWTLAFTFPGDQKITGAWNAVVTQTSAGVIATNQSYNAGIAPGGSQSFGFQGTWTSNDTSPASFTVNGAACT